MERKGALAAAQLLDETLLDERRINHIRCDEELALDVAVDILALGIDRPIHFKEKKAFSS